MDLKNLSIEELLALIEEAKSIIKLKKDNIEAINRNILGGVNEGRRIKILFKGEPTVVKFVGLTAKRFSVDLDGVKKSILLDKLISVDVGWEEEAV